MTEQPQQHEFAAIDAEYQRKLGYVRANEDLTPEAKSRETKAIGDWYDRSRREAEQAASERLENEAKTNYRAAFGPKRSNLTAAQEAAKELRLARIRDEVTDELSSGWNDPIRAYEHALKAGDEERAVVIGQVGAKHLEDPTRRRRLAELVAANEPSERKAAKQRLAEVDQRKKSLDIGSALNRRVRAKDGLRFSEIAQAPDPPDTRDGDASGDARTRVNAGYSYPARKSRDDS